MLNKSLENISALYYIWCRDQDGNRDKIAICSLSISDGDFGLWLRKFELCSTANGWKEDEMLKRLPTLLSGKAFAVFERLREDKKESFKTLVESIKEAFGGDATSKHIAMMEFRRQLAQQLDLTTVELTPELSSPNTDPNVNQMSVRRQPDTSYEPAIVGQLKECVEALTEKVNQLSASVSNISEVATIRAENPRRGRRGPCYNCGGVGHLSSECRQTKRRNDRGQRQNESYCFICGQQGHFARDCQYRYQGPRQPKQGNGRGLTRY